MPGNRASENGDYVTPRAAYREVSAVDSPALPTSTGISVLDTREKLEASTGQATPAWYGRNAQLSIAALIEGFTSVTLQLWLLAELEQREAQTEEEASSSSSASVSSEWVKAATDKTITASELWVVKDVPPGQYKIVVSAVAGSGTLVLREQHAA